MMAKNNPEEDDQIMEDDMNDENDYESSNTATAPAARDQDSMLDLASDSLSMQQQQQRQANNFPDQQQLNPNTAATNSSTPIIQQQPFDQLEKYGRWLSSIPRDDVISLRQTIEFQNFVQAFETLKVAHQQLPSMSITNPHDLLCGGATSVTTTTQNGITTTSTTTSFLQHFCLDDVLSRIFEFLDCTCLVRISGACSRFRELAQLSAHQRTLELQDTRQLNNVFKLLRAQEQIDGLFVLNNHNNDTETHTEHENTNLRSNNNNSNVSGTSSSLSWSIPRVVRVPLLGLSKPVIVQGAGDPEYNGIYFCTTTNGNGFVFTKPRVPEQRITAAMTTTATTPNTTTWMMNHHDNINGVAIDNNYFVHHNQNNNNNNQNNIIPGVGGDHHPMFVDGGNIHGGGGILFEDDTTRGRLSDYNHGGDDRDGRLLRCVIAKRFSNETILWYMSKEVIVGEEDGGDDTAAAAAAHHNANNNVVADNGGGGIAPSFIDTGGTGGAIRITQVFSFWAKLMVIGDANPDVCRYPSQTSILSRDGELAWQPLSSNQDMEPPVVELFD